MDVQVAIPTYRNDGRTIKFTLDMLTKQTYNDFSLLIAYKPSEGDRTLEVIDQFSKTLDIKVIYQKDGYVEEAMNLIYSSANADLLLTIDDDEVPSEDWVKEHVDFHEKFDKLGVARGKVKFKIPLKGTSLRDLVKRMIYKQYSPTFDGYSGYLTVYGIPTDRKGDFVNGIKKTLTIASENMSVKREVYNGFRLPGYTLRGFHHEIILSLNAVKKGFFTGEIDGGLAKEIERSDYGVSKESLSTPTSLKGRLNLIAEHFLFPYASNLVGFRPRRLQFIRQLLLLSYGGVEKKAVKLGLDLAIRGVKENLQPGMVRDLLRKGLDEIYKGELNI